MFWFMFSIFFAACLAAGVTGGLFAPGSWYRSLEKPWFTPPDWVFPVTWIVLYVCMAIAGARAAMLEGNGIAMAFWGLQIALNSLWSPVFFGLKQIRLGMAVVSCLWVAVLCALLALWQALPAVGHDRSSAKRGGLAVEPGCGAPSTGAGDIVNRKTKRRGGARAWQASASTAGCESASNLAPRERRSCGCRQAVFLPLSGNKTVRPACSIWCAA